MKRLRKIVSFVLVLAMILSISGASNVVNAAKVKVKSVKVAQPYAKNAYIAKGKSVKLSPTVSVTPNKKANKVVTYKSKNKSIVSINNKGVCKAKKVGKTKIIITSKKNSKKKATIAVQVMKAAVKTVKLNTTLAQLKEGQAIGLKATISPNKNVGKVINWTSSNEKVATVSSKGIVKAVKTGTATVKATAADGSKKSATCKVVVTKKSEEMSSNVDIIQVRALDLKTLAVTLNKSHSLNATNFIVQTKETAEGSYLNAIQVESISSYDGVTFTYKILLKKEITNGHYVKVAIPSLSGVKEKETKANKPVNMAEPSEQVISTTIGTYLDQGLAFPSYATGYVNVTAANLPTGFYAEKKFGAIYLRGKSDIVLDNVMGSITVIDEAGKQITKKFRFLVGSKDVIVAYAKPVTVLTGYSFEKKFTNNVVGGMNGITYELSGLPANVSNSGITIKNEIITDEATGMKSLAPIAPGIYPIQITFTDGTGRQAVCPTTLTVTDGVTLTGHLYDAAGEPIKCRTVKATCMSENDVDERNVYTDASGKYTMRVIPATYNLSASSWGVLAHNRTVSTLGANIDLRINRYRVTLAFPAMDEVARFGGTTVNSDPLNANSLATIIDAISWVEVDKPYYDDDDWCWWTYGGDGYVLPGTYSYMNTSNLSIKTMDANGKNSKSYNGNVDFTVTNSNIVATPTLSAMEKILPLDTPIDLKLYYGRQWLVTYQATESGDYLLTSDAIPKYEGLSSYDKIFNNKQIYFEFHLEAGKKEQVTIHSYSKEPIEITNLKFTKVD